MHAASYDGELRPVTRTAIMMASAAAVEPSYIDALATFQAEISQGTLQANFEFQSMICETHRMEVANASMYDGSTAAAKPS